MSLVAARYGKDLVRVLRVVRRKPNENGKIIHDIVEYNVRALVEGDISSRNLTFVFDQTDGLDTLDLAKTSPHVLSPELFATHVGAFLLNKYEHLSAAFVDIEMLKWSRLAVGEHGVDGVQGSTNGQGHRHSFQRDGEDKHIVNVEVAKSDNGIMSVKVTAGLCDLLLLKSSGSAFSHFIRDEFTTLVEVKDRILSTAVNLQYDFPKYTLKNGLGSIGAMETELEFKKAAELARNVTIDLFTTHDSESVQATLFKMGEAVIAGHKSVEKITYVLPNKHYIPVNLDHLGIANMTEDVAEVFMPVSAPRPQHVARHMRSHTGDRPYECSHCRDRFARSDLLSRHVNKCHASERPATTTQPARRRGHAQPGSSAAAGVSGPAPSLIPPPGTRKICDVCASSRTPAQCDAGLPCGKCLQRNSKCTYIKALETIRRPQATQGINYSRTTDLITPPMTVPSMGLPQRTDPALFPSQPSFNFPASLYSNLQGQSNTSSQSPYFNSNAGNQGSTQQPPNVHGQLPVPAPYPAFIPDHHQQQQTPSTMFAPYPATPHTAARAKNELDAYLLENAFGGANSLGGSAAASSSSYLYNNTHAQEFMAPNQHQPGLPHINDHHIGYPGYTPPSTARSVSSHSSQRSHSAHHSPQQQHQAAYSNTADSPASNDSPSYTHSSNVSTSNNAPSSTAQTQLLDGGVSSAFGMMSLDDPAIAAEMSKSGSFFAPNAFPKTPSSLNNNPVASHVGSSTGTGLTPFLGPNFNAKWSSPSLNSSAGLLTPGLGLGFTLGLGNVSSSNASLPSLGSSGLTPFLNGGNPLDGHLSTGMGNSLATGFTPGRESNIAELKEFWRQFMKTPGEKTPGVGTFGGFGKDGLHYDGSHTDSETSRPRHSLSKMASYPDLKTPGGTNVSQNAHAGNYSMSEKEDLRSYQQAVLARKAPQLTLIPKRRGTLPQTYGDIHAKPPVNMINNTQTNTSKPNNLIPQQQVNGSPSPSASSTHSNSDIGSLFTPTQRIVRERPTFKRLASQTLGPFEAKSAKISHQDINASEGSEDTDGNEDAEWLDVQESTVNGKTTQNSRQKPQSCAESVNNSSTRRLAAPEMVALS
ncbi:hypothetical protein Clacol_002901 [Clathrus columnatus]|uniref:factor independent urate hydroxylase n=1 Tax=Clathrus columnatus TaxID=1419009 RepID=A0AAV5A5C8_9AGAM|nr:hypothetical protein Clacol_002901 [Clathrus columnatus]